WRGGIGFKVLMVIGAWWLLGGIARMIAAGLYLAPVLIYLFIAAPVCFFFARRAQTSGTVKELEASAASLQHPTLIHVYPDQAPGPMWAVRFWSAAGKSTCDETQVNLQNVDPGAAAGASFLSFGDVATYRIGADADPVLVASKPGGLMNAHAPLLQRAVMECR